MHPPPTRALVCNIGRLGDAIIRNSILNSIRLDYEHVGYLCGKAIAPIVETDPRVDEVFVFENTLRGFSALVKATVLNSHDLYIDLKDHDSNTSLLIATLCRAKLKVGCNRKRYRPFHRDTSHTHGTMKKKKDVMRDIAAVAGLPEVGYQPMLTCSEDSKNWFNQTHPNLQPFYFVNISATAGARIWPEEHWISLLNDPMLTDTTILISALPKHREMLLRIAEGTKNSVPFKPRGIMDVAAAIERADATLTVDTGITQVAAALGKPMVVLYGSKEQAHDFAPGGDGNAFLSPDVNQRIETLRPAAVVEEVKAKLLSTK